jgi:hypothetical protein
MLYEKCTFCITLFTAAARLKNKVLPLWMFPSASGAVYRITQYRGMQPFGLFGIIPVIEVKMNNTKLSELLKKYLTVEFEQIVEDKEDFAESVGLILFDSAYPGPYEFDETTPVFSSNHFLSYDELLQVSSLKEGTPNKQKLYAEVVQDQLENLLFNTFFEIDTEHPKNMIKLVELAAKNLSEEYLDESDEFASDEYSLYLVLKELEEFSWLNDLEAQLAVFVDQLKIKDLLDEQKKSLVELCIENEISSNKQLDEFFDKMGERLSSVSDFEEAEDDEEENFSIPIELSPEQEAILFHGVGVFLDFETRYLNNYGEEFPDSHFTKEDGVWLRVKEIANSYHPEDTKDLAVSLDTSKSIKEWIFKGGDKPGQRQNIPLFQVDLEEVKEYLAENPPDYEVQTQSIKSDIDSIQAFIAELESHCFSTAIVTLTAPDGRSFVVDLHKENGEIEYGYQFGVKALFIAKLAGAGEGAGLMLRSFLDEKHPKTGLPMKEVRGYFVRFVDNALEYYPVPAAEVKQASTYDVDTGAPLEIEFEVRYR